MTTSLVEQIASLGIELNANQYKVVRLAAQYDATLDWFREGFKSSAVAIAHRLDIHDSTAREWIRVGHALDELGLVNDAFASNDLSYAKAHILTRWADRENEAELLEIAHDRTANRLTTAIAKHLAGTETDEDRDQRQHDSRSVTVTPTPMAWLSSEPRCLPTSASTSWLRSTPSFSKWPQRRWSNRSRKKTQM